MYQLFKILKFLFIFQVSICLGQQITEFEKLNFKDQVSQSITYSVVQDLAGNIWIASEDGVIKYNSSFSKEYNRYSGFPDQVGGRVNVMFVDHRNTVWAGTKNGLCVYSREKDWFRRIRIDLVKQPYLVRSITEDLQGNLWVGAYNGLWKISKNPEGYALKNHFERLDIESVLTTKSGEILIGAKKAFYKLNPKTEELRQIQLVNAGSNVVVTKVFETENGFLIGTEANGLFLSSKKLDHFAPVLFDGGIENGYTIRDIIKYKNGYLLGVDGRGIVYLDKSLKKINRYFQDQDVPTSISSDGIYDLLVDREGILWVATYGGGVNYLNDTRSIFKKIKHQINNRNSISNSFTRSIEVDNAGRIWFGTKKGISIWNRKSNTWSSIMQDDGVVLAMSRVGSDIWVSIYNRGVFKVNQNSLAIENISKKFPQLKSKRIYSLISDKFGNKWFGGVDGDLYEITVDNKLKRYPLTGVRTLFLRPDGNVFASNDNGVYLINPLNGSIKPVKILNFTEGPFQFAYVNAIGNYKKNQYLFATNGVGLLVYNEKNNTVKTINKQSGLPTDIVQSVIAVDQKNIWLGTSKGIVGIRYLKNDIIVNVFDKNDGLLSTEYNYGSYKKIGNEVFFGGVEGLTYFNPKKVFTEQNTPKIVFDEFRLFNKVDIPGKGVLENHINSSEKIVLDHDQNSISIKFIGILHNSPSKVKYSWYLEGFDENWTGAKNVNEVSYTNLNPGKYLFRVKAMNRFGVWGNERVIPIIVKSPWWASPFAYIIYFILFVSFFYFIIYTTKMAVNKKNADEQLEFFNSLTHEIKTPIAILLSTLESASENDQISVKETNEQIKKTIKRLNGLFEQMLNFQKSQTDKKYGQDVTQIKLEVFVLNIIENFKPLYAEQNIEIIIENNLYSDIFYFDKEALTKILYNLLSNAIKYSNSKGTVKVVLNDVEKGKIEIVVIDNGIGIPKDQQKNVLTRNFRARNVINSQKPGTGLGLMMIKSLIQKSNGKIWFESIENEGSKFFVHLKSQVKVTIEEDKKLIEEVKQHKEQFNFEVSEFENAKILVVEDNDELRKEMVYKLQKYFQVTEAVNGKIGLALVEQVEPDIILTDLIMPELDGVELCKKIKSNELTAHIPVFMMTVLNNASQKLESIESGVSEYFEKPIDIDILLAKILNILKHQKKLKEKYIHEVDKKVAVQSRNSKDLEFISDLENLLYEHVKNVDFSVADMCKHVGLSRTSLYMKLKELIDMSPQDFIIHIRLKYARDLLIKGGVNIKEVAYLSGFSNPKYFSTSFKKYFGITPSSFVQSLINETDRIAEIDE